MILVEESGKWFYVNPEFPDSKLSPEFDSDAYALQWRGRVGSENFGDIEELTLELENLKNGVTVVLPKNKAHAERMVQVGLFYLHPPYPQQETT